MASFVYYDNSAGKQLTLTERWNGKHWTIQSTAEPAKARSSELTAVS